MCDCMICRSVENKPILWYNILDRLRKGGMALAYENNHYIPQFILRQFGETINVYDVNAKALKRNQQTFRVFAERKIYPAELEKDIGYKLEAPFAKLFHDKLMSGKSGAKITLTRKELQLMKRFFLLETIRVISMKEIESVEKALADLYRAYFPSFSEVQIPDETAEERWHRNIKVIVETENLNKVSEHPLCTYEILKWSYIFNSGYFAFWDCADSGVDYIISDIGLTSEVEPSKLKDGFEHTKKDELCRLFDRELNSAKKSAYEKLLSVQSCFHENFYMFPLSKNRMIVTVNPFFELYDNKTKLSKPYEWPTVISSRRLFEKNVPPKQMVLLGKPIYKDDDEFIYTVQNVKTEDAEYINMLMLDRVESIMGYNDFEKIRSSVKRYIDHYEQIKMKPPVDYSALIDQI